jgi:hypothetical protein
MTGEARKIKLFLTGQLQGAIMKHVLLTFSIIVCCSSGMADSLYVDEASLPPRPIGQTVAGVILCGLSIPFLIIGIASFTPGGNDQDPRSGYNGLPRFLGVVGCAEAISGVVLLTRATIKWRLRAKMEQTRSGNLGLSTGVLFTYGF